MPQQHLDRLTAIDASFLLQEQDTTHMHIGGVVIFDGPSPDVDEFTRHIGSRLGLVPRYRQKVVDGPLHLGRPMWIDDPHFNLAYHVRETALPAPGSEEQLRNLTSRVFSQRLDRSKPLWEMWLVQNLEGGRFALITKTHHSLIDGVAGADLLTTLFDLSPDADADADAPGDGLEPWQPTPEPSRAQLAAHELSGVLADGVGAATGLLGAVGDPGALLETVRDRATGLGEVVWTALNPPPASPITVKPGPHRRFEMVFEDLEDFKRIKRAFDSTVNDVVLAVVAGALAKFFHARGLHTEGVELRAAVPISVRAKGQEGAMGNQLTQIVCPLPVYITDPAERVRFCKEAMDGIKSSKQALGAETIANAEGFAPPTILAQATRLNFSSRLYSLLVTNIPGPQFPLYVLGRRLERMCPVAFLGGDHALAIAVISYDGSINFGLIADRDAIPDLDVLAQGIEASVAELVSLADEREHTGDVSRANGRTR